MATSNIFRLVVKLVVIFLSVSIHNHLFLHQLGATGLQIVPLWIEDDNITELCTITLNSDHRVASFHGTAYETCSLEVTAEPDHRIRIEMPTAFSDHDFLYVEKLGDVIYCPFQYIVIVGDPEDCSTIFGHEHLQLNLQSNERILLSEIQASTANNECPKFDQNVAIGSSKTTQICNLKGYQNFTTCDIEWGGFLNTTGLCRFEFPPEGCNVSISKNEVTFICLEPDSLHSGNVSLLLYPDELTELDLSSNNIANISADSFANLYNLQGLYLNSNPLISLQLGVFDNLHNLKFLLLNGSKLESVGKDLFTNLGMLTHLFLSENMLDSLPNELLKNLLNLEVLLLDKNLLNTLNSDFFSSLKYLQELDLSNNNFSTIPIDLFDDLENLQILRLGGNKFATIDSELVKSLKNLTTLSLDNNLLTTLPVDLFQELDNLNELYLHKNEIISLNENIFNGLNNLTILRLHKNNISEIPISLFQNLNNLQILSLGNNQLTELDSNIFQGLANLSVLYLDNNMLQAIPADLFQEQQNISEIRLNSNFIEQFDNDTFQGLYKLTKLYLQYNNLTELPAGLFRDLQDLQLLTLFRNQLTELDCEIFRGLTNLTVLNLNLNFLTEVPYDLFQGLKNLIRLNFQSNLLISLDNRTFRGLTSLETLRLTNNSLTELPADLFQGLESLIQIELRGNQLTSLPVDIFRGLYTLQHLFIHHNDFHNMPAGIFDDLVDLTLLRLNENEFTTLDIDLFGNLINLTFLDISANHFRDIPQAKVLPQLTILGASHNPLNDVDRSSFSSLSNGTKLLVSQHEICECLAPKDVECVAEDSRSPYLTCKRLLSDRILVGAMWIIGLNALIGNMFVLVWKQRHSGKNRVQSILLSNLAVSDFLMGVYMIIIGSADIYYGESFPMRSEAWRSGGTCRFASTLAILSSEASVFFVTLISIERFICIKFPQAERKNRVRNTMITVVLSWVFALALSSVPSALAGRNFKFYDNSHVCIGLPLSLLEIFSKQHFEPVQWEKTSFWLASSYSISEGLQPGLYYSTALFLGLNFVCFLLILGCYLEIVRTVKSLKNLGGTFMHNEIRMTLKVTAIVATDFFCWFPIIILGILVQSRTITLPPHTYAWLVTCVLPVNSAVNPYLYTIAEVISNYCKERREGSAQVQKSSVTQEVNAAKVNNNLDQTKM